MDGKPHQPDTQGGFRGAQVNQAEAILQGPGRVICTGFGIERANISQKQCLINQAKGEAGLSKYFVCLTCEQGREIRAGHPGFRAPRLTSLAEVWNAAGEEAMKAKEAKAMEATPAVKRAEKKKGVGYVRKRYGKYLLERVGYVRKRYGKYLLEIDGEYVKSNGDILKFKTYEEAEAVLMNLLGTQAPEPFCPSDAAAKKGPGNMPPELVEGPPPAPLEPEPGRQDPEPPADKSTDQSTEPPPPPEPDPASPPLCPTHNEPYIDPFRRTLGCRKCAQERGRKGGLATKILSVKGKGDPIAVDLSLVPGLREALDEACRINVRTPEQQILYWATQVAREKGWLKN